MIRRKLTMAEQLKISALSKAGIPQRTIAKELTLDIRHVRRFQRESGMPMPTNALPQPLVTKIVELHRAGMAQDEIARKLQLNEITVSKYRRAAGLAAHKRGAIPPEVAEKIAARLKRKQSQRRIAGELKVTEYQVKKVGRNVQN